MNLVNRVFALLALCCAAMVPQVAQAAVIEFYNPDLNNYFITAEPAEQAMVDTGAVGRWQRTGNAFATGGPNQVCRFYGNSNINPATGTFYGPNSHFYTAEPAECAYLKSIYTPNAKSWNFESNDFLTTPAVNGTCPAGLAPVYRAYNDGFAKGIDSNHRITSNRVAYLQTVAAGSIGEGVVMCAPSAVPQAGWWWNPAENGRWFFLESGNTDTQLVGYFYAGDGRATWLSSVGPNADPYSYSGRLLGYRDGQTLFGDYKPPAAPTDAGSVALTFSNDTHAGLTWPGGAVPLERARFGTGDAPFQPDTGWWSNPDENGRAYSIEVQGDSLFAGAYMYDDSGNPVWYYSSGKMATPTTYEGQWLQSANGQTLAGPWRAPGAPIAVGGLSIEFTAIDEASLTFTESAAAVAARAQPKRFKTTTVKRNRPVKPNPLPARFDGNFTQTIFDEHTSSDVTTTTTATVKGNLTWVLDPNDGDLVFLGSLRSPHAFYTLTGSEKPLTLDLVITLVGAGSTCNGNIDGLKLPLPPSNSVLEVNGYGQYSLDINFTAYSRFFTITCRSGDTSIPAEVFANVPVTFELEKTMVYGVTGGGRSETTSGLAHFIVTTSFSFAAVSAN